MSPCTALRSPESEKTKCQHVVEVFRKRIFCTNGHFLLHLIVEAAGCVESHSGVESACANNAATLILDKIHDVGH